MDATRIRAAAVYVAGLSCHVKAPSAHRSKGPTNRASAQRCRNACASSAALGKAGRLACAGSFVSCRGTVVTGASVWATTKPPTSENGVNKLNDECELLALMK